MTVLLSFAILNLRLITKTLRKAGRACAARFHTLAVRKLNANSAQGHILTEVCVPVEVIVLLSPMSLNMRVISKTLRKVAKHVPPLSIAFCKM